MIKNLFYSKIIIYDFSLIKCFSIIFDKVEQMNDFEKNTF